MLYISVDCIHHGAVTVVWQMKFTGYIMTGINNISSVTVTGINVVELWMLTVATCRLIRKMAKSWRTAWKRALSFMAKILFWVMMEGVLNGYPATTMALLFHIIHSEQDTSSGYGSTLPCIYIVTVVVDTTVSWASWIIRYNPAKHSCILITCKLCRQSAFLIAYVQVMCTFLLLFQFFPFSVF